jgi:hypothetical protein
MLHIASWCLKHNWSLSDGDDTNFICCITDLNHNICEIWHNCTVAMKRPQSIEQVFFFWSPSAGGKLSRSAVVLQRKAFGMEWALYIGHPRVWSNFSSRWLSQVYRTMELFADSGAVYTWEGGLKPKSTSGTRLGGWEPLEVGYLPKSKEVRNGLWLKF